MSLTVTQTLSDKAQSAITKARAIGDGWRAASEFLKANPDIAEAADTYDHAILICLIDDVMARLADYVRRGKAAGAKVEKHYTNDYGGAKLWFGPVYVEVYATRDEVCTRVVTGTTEVTEEVPDPEALAAVPKVTVTRTEELVEWQCHPILSASIPSQDGEVTV